MVENLALASQPWLTTEADCEVVEGGLGWELGPLRSMSGSALHWCVPEQDSPPLGHMKKRSQGYSFGGSFQFLANYPWEPQTAPAPLLQGLLSHLMCLDPKPNSFYQGPNPCLTSPRSPLEAPYGRKTVPAQTESKALPCSSLRHHSDWHAVDIKVCVLKIELKLSV